MTPSVTSLAMQALADGYLLHPDHAIVLFKLAIGLDGHDLYDKGWTKDLKSRLRLRKDKVVRDPGVSSIPLICTKHSVGFATLKVRAVIG